MAKHTHGVNEGAQMQYCSPKAMCPTAPFTATQIPEMTNPSESNGLTRRVPASPSGAALSAACGAASSTSPGTSSSDDSAATAASSRVMTENELVHRTEGRKGGGDANRAESRGIGRQWLRQCSRACADVEDTPGSRCDDRRPYCPRGTPALDTVRGKYWAVHAVCLRLKVVST